MCKNAHSVYDDIIFFIYFPFKPEKFSKVSERLIVIMFKQ